MLLRTNNLTSLRVPVLAVGGTKQSLNSEIASPYHTNPHRCSQRRSLFCVRSLNKIRQDFISKKVNQATEDNSPGYSTNKHVQNNFFFWASKAHGNQSAPDGC